MRKPIWTTALVLLGLLLVGLLLHHVAEAHHDNSATDCPICLLAASLFIVAAVVSIPSARILLWLILPFRAGHASTTSAVARGRSPPQSAIL